jgi:hypothetical protein
MDNYSGAHVFVFYPPGPLLSVFSEQTGHTRGFHTYMTTQTPIKLVLTRLTPELVPYHPWGGCGVIRWLWDQVLARLWS